MAVVACPLDRGCLYDRTLCFFLQASGTNNSEVLGRKHHSSPLAVLAMQAVTALLACIAAMAASQDAIFTNGPFIGILGVPASNCVTLKAAQAALQDKPTGADSCIGYYYTGFLEAAGARVVGIPYNLSDSQLEEVLSGLSGVLFTGGGLSLQPSTSYFNTALRVYEFVVRRNMQDGVYIPLHGTCMGF